MWIQNKNNSSLRELKMNLPTHHGFFLFAGLTRSWCRWVWYNNFTDVQLWWGLCKANGKGGGGLLLTDCHGYQTVKQVAKATPPPLLSGHQIPNSSSEFNGILTWSHVRAVLAMGLIAFSGSLCISSSSYL